MKIGVVFPQTEIGSGPAVIRDYAQTVEGLGFTHILAYDHVLGANPDRSTFSIRILPSFVSLNHNLAYRHFVLNVQRVASCGNSSHANTTCGRTAKTGPAFPC